MGSIDWGSLFCNPTPPPPHPLHNIKVPLSTGRLLDYSLGNETIQSLTNLLINNLLAEFSYKHSYSQMLTSKRSLNHAVLEVKIKIRMTWN